MGHYNVNGVARAVLAFGFAAMKADALRVAAASHCWWRHASRRPSWTPALYPVCMHPHAALRDRRGPSRAQKFSSVQFSFSYKQHTSACNSNLHLI